MIRELIRFEEVTDKILSGEQVFAIDIEENGTPYIVVLNDLGAEKFLKFKDDKQTVFFFIEKE